MKTSSFQPNHSSAVKWLTGVGASSILLAAFFGDLPITWRAVLLFGGCWLLALGVLYQVKLYATDRNARYYVVLVLAVVYWLALGAVTVFWFVRQLA